MNRRCFGFLIPAGAVFALPPNNTLRGVWKVVGYVVTGKGEGTYPAQPGLYIFTEKYFSTVMVSGREPRPEANPAKASDTEIVASWRPFVAQAGAYELSGSSVTMYPAVAKVSSRMLPGAR
jgi:Lipocalin-like domain